MRKGFNRLCGVIQNHLCASPTNGSVYIFINKIGDKVKLLHWSGSSFIRYYKRLESGTFEIPYYYDEVERISLSYSQLVLLLDGIPITNISRRKRYKSILENV